MTRLVIGDVVGESAVVAVLTSGMLYWRCEGDKSDLKVLGAVLYE